MIKFELAMKKIQAHWLILSMVVAGLLVSCSHKAPMTRVDRNKWNHTMLNGIYETAGNRNPKWDKDAEDALNDYADSRTASEDEVKVLSDLIGDSAENAVNEGCNDPMIHYLYVRYSSDVQAKPLQDRQDLFRTAANDLQNSSYPLIWKFYANYHAADVLWYNHDANLEQQVAQFRGIATSDLAQAVQEKSFPEAEAYAATDVLFQLLQYSPEGMAYAYNEIESPLSHQPDKAAMADFVKATYYIQYAWEARGHGNADQVTADGWRLFKERLDIAQKALEHAWSLDQQDAQIPILMISVVLGEQTGRPEMEKWFDRAMKADPENYQACRAKLHFLLPEWYGSRDDMLEFGRECVASTNWGGNVPLILVDAHLEYYNTLSAEESRGYWLLPDVWPDIQSSYEKYAQLNPDETHFRYPYAWYALYCLQTNDFVEQINLIRTNDGEINYNYCGGKRAFDRAWAFATGTPMSTNGAAASSQ
jgi:hypothetical protein